MRPQKDQVKQDLVGTARSVQVKTDYRTNYNSNNTKYKTKQHKIS